MLKPVPPAPSDSLLYAPAVFVKSVLTQTQEEISESVHVQLHSELFKVITFKEVVWDRDVCRALSLSLWRQGGEIQQEREGCTALQVRVPGQGVGSGGWGNAKTVRNVLALCGLNLCGRCRWHLTRLTVSSCFSFPFLIPSHLRPLCQNNHSTLSNDVHGPS